MYLWECVSYLAASGQLDKDLSTAQVKKIRESGNRIQQGLETFNDDYEAYRLQTNDAAPLTQAIPGSEPRDMGCIYNRTDNVLDVRTPFDEWRGLATFVFCALVYEGYDQWSWTLLGLFKWVQGFDHFDRPITAGVMVGNLFSLILSSAITWIFFRYCLRWFRLEVLTQRRLIIRFNRKTRKVWLHRPPSCGGVVALDWDKCFAGTPDTASPDQVTSPLGALSWIKGHGADIPTLAFFGRIFGSDRDSASLWEYIRRFMEVGPQSLPAFTWRERLSKFPWPWLSLYAPWSFFLPLLKRVPVLWIVFVLLSPVLLFWGVFHWVSLLLCWEPRFPKEAD